MINMWNLLWNFKVKGYKKIDLFVKTKMCVNTRA